jgi:hypothetical protein
LITGFCAEYQQDFIAGVELSACVMRKIRRVAGAGAVGTEIVTVFGR